MARPAARQGLVKATLQQYLAGLKLRIETDSTDPTEIVNSVLLLGTEVLGYKCISGYHDEVVAHHLGFQRTADCGQFDPWQDKTWELRPDNDGPRHLSAVLAPRGSGKTVWATVLAVWYGVRQRNVRVLVTSKTDKAALRTGGVIRRLLLKPRMRAIWGDLRGDTWDKQGFNIEGRTLAEGATTYTLLGSGSQIEGVHFDVIFADDIVTLLNSRTPGMRANLWEWFWQTLSPTCRPVSELLGRGRIHGSGTRYNAADMHQALEDQGQTWSRAYRRFPALRPSKRWRKKHATEINAWKTARVEAEGKGQEAPAPPEPQPEPLKDGTINQDPRNWDSVAPEFLPVPVLLAMREDMPRPFFDAQYQVDARLLKGRLIKADLIEWAPEEPNMRGLPGCSGMDLGLKLSESADYTALVHVKMDRKWKHPDSGQVGRLLIWDATVDHLDLAGKLRLLRSDHRTNRPRSQGVEKVQAQSLLLENPELAGLPVVGVIPAGDKLLRASLLLTWFESGRIFFVDRKGSRATRINEHLQMVVYQLLEFQGDGTGHDDAVDALGYAVDQITSKWRQAADASGTPPKAEPKQENPLGLRADYAATRRSGSKW